MKDFGVIRAAHAFRTISGKSREIARVHEAASADSAQRAQKVAEIKSRIENNEYQVDSEQVAHKMVMDFLKELV